jgi:uncharacterized protein YprB with RNaseH-like and TPR domain
MSCPFIVGILFDVETTGLDTATDEVVELGWSSVPIIRAAAFRAHQASRHYQRNGGRP